MEAKFFCLSILCFISILLSVKKMKSKLTCKKTEDKKTDKEKALIYEPSCCDDLQGLSGNLKCLDPEQPFWSR